MRRDRLHFLFIVAISFALTFQSTYDGYNNIVEADFLKSGQTYENSDIGNLSVDKQNFTGVSPYPCCTFLEENFFTLLWGFSVPTPLVQSTSSVLRC